MGRDIAQRPATVLVLARRLHLAVGGHPHQPAENLDITIGPRQQVGLARRIRRLNEHFHAAGAILLGKLNLTEGAMGGYHSELGIPLNPWNPARIERP